MLDRSTPLVRAALVVAAVLAASPARAGDATPNLEQAKKHMEAGVAFLRDPDGAQFEAAFEQFRVAYEQSGSLNALQNMGLCAQKLERFGEAIAAYQKVLTQPADKLGAEERGQIEQDLKALTTAVAWLELTTSETTATITDRRVSSTPIVNVYQVPGGKKKLGVSPGTHELTASAPGQPDRVWTTTLTSGQSGSHHFDFSKSDAPTHRPLPTSVWVIGATSLGLVVAGGTLVGVSVSKSAAKDEAIKRHALPQEIDKLEKEAVAYTAAGGATLGLAGVGLVTATVLGVTRPEVPVAGGRLPMRVLPQIALGMVGATLLARW